MEKDSLNLFKIITKIFSIIFIIIAIAYIFIDFFVLGYYSSMMFKNLISKQMDNTGQIMFMSLVLTIIILAVYLLILMLVKNKYPKPFIGYNYLLSLIVNTVILKKLNHNNLRLTFIKDNKSLSIGGFYLLVILLGILATKLKLDFLVKFQSKLDKMKMASVKEKSQEEKQKTLK